MRVCLQIHILAFIHFSSFLINYLKLNSKIRSFILSFFFLRQVGHLNRPFYKMKHGQHSLRYVFLVPENVLTNDDKVKWLVLSVCCVLGQWVVSFLVFDRPLAAKSMKYSQRAAVSHFVHRGAVSDKTEAQTAQRKRVRKSGSSLPVWWHPCRRKAL